MANRLNKNEVLDAIPGSKGLINQIAKKLNVSWHTANKYIKKWKETKTAYNNERNKTIDYVESKVLQAINKGDMNTARWYLGNMARDRGYGNLDNQNSNTPTNNINIIKEVKVEVTNEQTANILNMLYGSGVKQGTIGHNTDTQDNKVN